LKLPYKGSRKAAGYTAQEAAEVLHIDKRSLYRIEAGQQQASPEMAWQMARLYKDPDLIRWYQSEVDPVGRRMQPPVLNGIVNSPQAVHYKLVEVLGEAVPAASELCSLTTNKLAAPDFTEHEIRQYFSLYGKCISNVKQAVAEVEGAAMRMFGFDAVEEAGKAHRDKMLQKGYLRTKEKAHHGATDKISYESLPLSHYQVKEPCCYYQ